MSKPPRVWIAGVNSSSSHASSLITSTADLPSILAFTKSGTCVVEWLPQMVTFVTVS